MEGAAKQRQRLISATIAGLPPRSYQSIEWFTIQTADSMAGTSISIPTMMPSAAPEWKLNRLMAAAAGPRHPDHQLTARRRP